MASRVFSIASPANPSVLIITKLPRLMCIQRVSQPRLFRRARYSSKNFRPKILTTFLKWHVSNVCLHCISYNLLSLKFLIHPLFPRLNDVLCCFIVFLPVCLSKAPDLDFRKFAEEQGKNNGLPWGRGKCTSLIQLKILQSTMLLYICIYLLVKIQTWCFCVFWYLYFFVFFQWIHHYHYTIDISTLNQTCWCQQIGWWIYSADAAGVVRFATSRVRLLPWDGGLGTRR